MPRCISTGRCGSTRTSRRRCCRWRRSATGRATSAMRASSSRATTSWSRPARSRFGSRCASSASSASASPSRATPTSCAGDSPARPSTSLCNGGSLTDGSGIGGELRAAREALGLGLGQVAQQLKFAPRQLEALEEERFDQLPGRTLARGLVRSYARLLKLDPEPLVTRLSGRFDAPDAGQLAARYSQPVPFSDNARRSTMIYLGLSLGVLLLVG